MKIILEEPGTMYGYWEVIDNTYRLDKGGNHFIKVRCTLCGRIHEVRGFALRLDRSHACRRCAMKMRGKRNA